MATAAGVDPNDQGLLFEKTTLGGHQLNSRIVFAALTRCRALGNIPQQAAAVYYSQRAREGMCMLSEAAAVSQQGIGLACVPGVYTAEQLKAWKPIVKAVKDKGGVFWMQLWHSGRASHNDYQPEGQPPVGPSAISISKGQVYAPRAGRMADYPTPRALDAGELPAIAEDFAQGARNALAAGFEGIELHAANGYLLDQFLKQSSNTRTDAYGGSIENRVRFVLEVVDAVVAAIGDPQKVGIRLSPYTTESDCYEPDEAASIQLNCHLLRELSKRGLAYAHIVTPHSEGSATDYNGDLKVEALRPFREAFTSGRIIAAGGFLRQSAEQVLRSGTADLITFGRWFLANPDFVERLRDGKPFNRYNGATFCSQDQVLGYTDYPFLKDIPADTPVETHSSGQQVFAAWE